MPNAKKDAILVITSPNDDHEAWIIEESNRRNIDVVSLYTENFPSQVTSTQCIDNTGQNYLQFDDNSGKSIRGVLVRRPGIPKISDEIDEDYEDFAVRESLSALEGLYHSLSHCHWVNEISQIRVAELKIYQISIAQKLGFKLPRTLITNESSKALAFLQDCEEKIVQKSLTPFIVSDEDGSDYGLFTSKVQPEEFDHMLESIQMIPCFFQELITKKYELRINVIGDYVWTVAIHSPDDAPLDYRANPNLCTFEPIILPDGIKEKCLRLTRHLGLIMGNIDMIVTPENEYYFLEINPCGQWAWVEKEVGFPLCTALVDQLVGVDSLSTHPYIKDNSLIFEPNTAILGYSP